MKVGSKYLILQSKRQGSCVQHRSFCPHLSFSLLTLTLTLVEPMFFMKGTCQFWDEPSSPNLSEARIGVSKIIVEVSNIRGFPRVGAHRRAAARRWPGGAPNTWRRDCSVRRPAHCAPLLARVDAFAEIKEWGAGPQPNSAFNSNLSRPFKFWTEYNLTSLSITLCLFSCMSIVEIYLIVSRSAGKRFFLLKISLYSQLNGHFLIIMLMKNVEEAHLKDKYSKVDRKWWFH